MSFIVEIIFYHALITIYHFSSYGKKKKKIVHIFCVNLDLFIAKVLFETMRLIINLMGLGG